MIQDGTYILIFRKQTIFSEGKLEPLRKYVREGSYKDRWGLVNEKKGKRVTQVTRITRTMTQKQERIWHL